MGAPIRSGLSALIVTKATRRKDVKVAARSIDTHGISDKGRANGNGAINGNGTVVNGKHVQEVDGDEDEDTQKSRQAQINLVSVDKNRLPNIKKNWYLFPETIIRLVVSTWILVALIGWAALLAGFAVMILVLHLNIYTSKDNTDTQGE